MTEYFTMGKAAKLIGVHKMTLYRMEKTGKLAAIGVKLRRLRHGTRERQISREQIETIKRYREEINDAKGKDSS